MLTQYPHIESITMKAVSLQLLSLYNTGKKKARTQMRKKQQKC